MSEVDSYEFAQSNLPQGLMRNKPFSDYQYNYINDINSSVYNNINGSSLVQFDLSSLYNSSKFTNTQSHFIVIPILRCAEARTSANAKVNLTNTNYYLTTLKNLNTCLINSIDLTIGSKSIHQITPNINLFNGVKLLSQLSADDIELMGGVLGIYDIDTPGSMSYSADAADGFSSPGISNNYVNGSPTPNITGNNVPQGSEQANLAVQLKTMQNRCIAGARNLDLVNNATQMFNEFQPTYEVGAVGTGNEGQAIWKDYIIIFMKDILDAMDKIGIVRKLDAVLRIYVNTGFCRVTYDTANVSRLSFNGNDTTFSESCPVLINHCDQLPAANVASLNVGVFIGSAPSYVFNSTNFAGIQSSMRACRYYFNNITLNPSMALDYISSNASKQIVYDCTLYNTFTNITSPSNFSQLIQAGVTNIKTIILIPLISASVHGFSGFKSPFDPCGGAGYHPISLTSFNVQVGGVNQLSTNLDFVYENFIEQVSKFNKSSNSEYGVNSGLISEAFWRNNRVYMCNVRSTEDDLNTPRNVVISFKNNSSLTIDVVCFIVYEDKCVINVSTGMITK